MISNLYVQQSKNEIVDVEFSWGLFCTERRVNRNQLNRIELGWINRGHSVFSNNSGNDFALFQIMNKKFPNKNECPLNDRMSHRDFQISNFGAERGRSPFSPHF